MSENMASEMSKTEEESDEAASVDVVWRRPIIFEKVSTSFF